MVPRTLFGGNLSCSHIKRKTANTAHENHLAKYNALVPSASSDKRWAIRTVASRIHYIWIVASVETADLPHADKTQIMPTRQKMLVDEANFAIKDQNWGHWAPSGAVRPKRNPESQQMRLPPMFLAELPMILASLPQQLDGLMFYPLGPRPMEECFTQALLHPQSQRRKVPIKSVAP